MTEHENTSEAVILNTMNSTNSNKRNNTTSTSAFRKKTNNPKTIS